MSEKVSKYLTACDALAETDTIRSAYLGLEQLIEVNRPHHEVAQVMVNRGDLLALLRVLNTRLQHDMNRAEEALRQADPRGA